MKGGQTPIHIMRWAPADYVNDPAVRLALHLRDFVSLTFYHLFLQHAWIEGGDLPADPDELGAILGMRAKDVRRALAYWIERGKLKESAGRLYHARVVREVAEELAYRELQSERGKKGGRPPKSGAQTTPEAGGIDPAKPPLFQCESPPAPAPAPAPAPDARRRSPAGNPLVSGRRQQLEAECLQLVRSIAKVTGELEEDVIARGAHYHGATRTQLNPASMTDDRLLNTIRDLRHDLDKLVKQRDLGRPVAARA